MKIKHIIYLLLIISLLSGCSDDSLVVTQPTPLPTIAPTTSSSIIPSVSPEILSENDTDRTAEKVVNTLLSQGWIIVKYDSGTHLVFEENEFGMYLNYIDSRSLHTDSISRLQNVYETQEAYCLVALKDEGSMEACEYNFVTKEYENVFMDYDLPEPPTDKELLCSQEMIEITDEVVEEYYEWLATLNLKAEDILTLWDSDFQNIVK